MVKKSLKACEIEICKNTKPKQGGLKWDNENLLLSLLEVNQTWNGGTISAKEQHCASSGIFRNSAFILLSLKFTSIILWLFKITIYHKYQKIADNTEYTNDVNWQHELN